MMPWQILYEETQHLAIQMQDGLLWQVILNLDFSSIAGICVGSFFVIIIPVLMGKREVKKMGCIFLFLEGFALLWLSFWLFATVFSNLRFSETPYLVKVEKCKKQYSKERESYFIIGITKTQHEITSEGLTNKRLFTTLYEDEYWVSTEVFELAKQDTTNQLILINDEPIGIVTSDSTFYLDY